MKMQPLDYRILSQLLQNSKVTDRKLATILGSSQPTVSRRRRQLEKAVVDGYTVVPKLEEMGYEIIALTFIAGKREQLTKPKFQKAQKKAKEWHFAHPNVLYAGAGQGMGEWTGLVVSIHRNYSDFVEFKKQHDTRFGKFLKETRSFLISIDPKMTLKPFHLKYLSELGPVEEANRSDPS